MAEQAGIDEPDPLGRRRCANCLYERRGLPADVSRYRAASWCSRCRARVCRGDR